MALMVRKTDITCRPKAIPIALLYIPHSQYTKVVPRNIQASKDFKKLNLNAFLNNRNIKMSPSEEKNLIGKVLMVKIFSLKYASLGFINLKKKPNFTRICGRKGFRKCLGSEKNLLSRVSVG
jgi:hypothetical protein